MPRASLANEGYLGGKDAQRTENSRIYNPDFKIANNSFKIVNGLVLGFGGEEILPFLFQEVNDLSLKI